MNISVLPVPQLSGTVMRIIPGSTHGNRLYFIHIFCIFVK